MSKLLVSAVLAVALLAICALMAQAEQGGQVMDKQGKSASGNGASHNHNAANSIDVGQTQKSKLEAEKREVQQFFTARNILKSIVNLILGNQNQIHATSRQVLGVLGKVLDLVKSQFGQKARTGSSARTLRDSAEDVASAGVSILQGYVKSVLSTDESCVHFYQCQANQEAVRDNKEIGSVVGVAGSYATSYLLDNNIRPKEYSSLMSAGKYGRDLSANCTLRYPCDEANRAESY